MNSFLILSIPSGIVLVTVGGLFAVLRLYHFSRKGKRSPLTSQLLRSPGETLRTQIDDISLDITFYSVIAPIIPLSLYATYLSQIYLAGAKVTSFVPSFYIILSLALVLYCALKLWSLLKKRSFLSLALDCEMAVGQELNQLMLEGCRVYHDFPADKFNIDHVVVSPKGVFAVETKGRAKRDKKGGTAEATVTYDGEKLNFPGWSEKEPLEQAKRQAKWLANWLGSAVGEPVSVKPVLVLPGWYVELKKPADVFIFNGKNPQSLLKGREYVLPETMIKRVAHQIEQRCRDVEPVAYSKKAQGK